MSHITATSNYQPIGHGSVASLGNILAPHVSAITRPVFDTSYLESFLQATPASKPSKRSLAHYTSVKNKTPLELSNKIALLLAIQQDCEPENRCSTPGCPSCSSETVTAERLTTMHVLRSKIMADRSFQALALNIHSPSGAFAGNLSESYAKLSDAVPTILQLLNRGGLSSFVIYHDFNLLTPIGAEFDSDSIPSMDFNAHCHGVALVKNPNISRLQDLFNLLAESIRLPIELSIEALNRNAPKGCTTSFQDIANYLVYASKGALSNAIGSKGKVATADRFSKFIRNRNNNPYINAMLFGHARRWASNDLANPAEAIAKAETAAIDMLLELRSLIHIDSSTIDVLNAVKRLISIKTDICSMVANRKLSLVKQPSRKEDTLARQYNTQITAALAALYELLPGILNTLMLFCGNLPARIADIRDMAITAAALRFNNDYESCRTMHSVFPSIVQGDTCDSLAPYDKWLQSASYTLLA